jgi:SAM-dependent methyltransferase
MMPVNWYDEAFTEIVEYRMPYKISRYYPIWKAVLDFIPERNSILDIGCGTGQFAQMVIENGRKCIGVDFSDVALKQAKKFNPESEFIKADIDKLEQLSVNYEHIDTVVFVEVLEHIQNDINALIYYAADKPVVLTLPMFLSESHVRCFYTKNAIIERYDMFDFDSIINIEKSRIFICSCRRHESLPR